MTLAEESERDLGLLLRAVIMTGAAAHVWGGIQSNPAVVVWRPNAQNLFNQTQQMGE